MDSKVLALSSLSIVLFGGVVLASSPVRQFLSPQGAGENVYDRSLDPAVGAVFPLPREDAYGVPLPAKARTVVIIAGSCASCSLHAIDPRQVVPSADSIYLFAYQTDRKDLHPWMTKLPPGVRVIADQDSSLRKAANSAWQPRYVVLDQAHRVQIISNDDAGVPEYVHLRGRA